MDMLVLLMIVGLILYFIRALPSELREVGRLTFFAALLGFCIRYHGEMLHALR
jgi:hypothetical protein